VSQVKQQGGNLSTASLQCKRND